MNGNNKAIFLDRDGVINVDFGYVHHPNQIVFVPGIFELCKEAADRNYVLVVITNQAGVGKGFFPLSDVEETNAFIFEKFSGVGLNIADFLVCPHAPTDGCFCRKPAPYLFFQAINRFSLDPCKCIAVGDKPSDTQAAESAGIKQVFEISSRYNSGGNASNLQKVMEQLKWFR